MECKICGDNNEKNLCNISYLRGFIERGLMKEAYNDFVEKYNLLGGSLICLKCVKEFRFNNKNRKCNKKKNFCQLPIRHDVECVVGKNIYGNVYEIKSCVAKNIIYKIPHQSVYTVDISNQILCNDPNVESKYVLQTKNRVKENTCPFSAGSILNLVIESLDYKQLLKFLYNCYFWEKIYINKVLIPTNTYSLIKNFIDLCDINEIDYNIVIGVSNILSTAASVHGHDSDKEIARQLEFIDKL